jgi:nickel-dependent lactate racemase
VSAAAGMLEKTATSGAVLSPEDIETVIAASVDHLGLAGKRVLIIIPDGTRTMPLPLFFRLFARHLVPRAAAVDYLVGLGTHPPLSRAALEKLVGWSEAEAVEPLRDQLRSNVQLLNHAWDDPDALTLLGTIPAEEIARLSGDRLRLEVPVRLNRLVLDYDHLLVCGPVFPHEVVGFSGGNKYFFPGIAGPDIINFTHWLGALITSRAMIGTKDTPVRRVIDRAAAFIPRPRSAICVVVTHQGVAGLACGTPEAAWSAAADLSAQRHIIWTERPWKKVLAVLPVMYDELWVGAKGMYKTEPAIADGGEVIIYAPHLDEVSVVHGRLIEQLGYHVRDYFLHRWDEFKHLSWGVLAHSTHLKGSGTYTGGVERPRIQVTLATGLSEERCRRLNLGYLDPRSIAPQDYAGREAEGVLLIPRAGEYLHRLRGAAD